MFFFWNRIGSIQVCSISYFPWRWTWNISELIKVNSCALRATLTHSDSLLHLLTLRGVYSYSTLLTIFVCCSNIRLGFSRRFSDSGVGLSALCQYWPVVLHFESVSAWGQELGRGQAGPRCLSALSGCPSTDCSAALHSLSLSLSTWPCPNSISTLLYITRLTIFHLKLIGRWDISSYWAYHITRTS